jgi:glycosyltransferase involved in cell wall biosynthesis
VTFVSSHDRGGGSERYLELLLELLGPAWVESVASLEDGALARRLRAGSLPLDVIPASGGHLSVLLAARRLRRALRGRRPDLVHANGLKAALVSALATTGTGIPLVWVKHDFARDGITSTLVARRCRQVVAVSEAVAETFAPDTRLRKVHVVRTGVPEPSLTRAAARVRLAEIAAADERERLVALVGYFHPVKGQRELIELAPAVVERVPDVRFVLIGSEHPGYAEYARSLRERVSALELDGSIVFAGYCEDAAALIGGADLLVIPSGPHKRVARVEGFPLVALEALAAGTPVVGYATGGLPELLAGRGLMVAAGDRDALRDAILRVLEDDGLRSRLAESGRELAVDRYSTAGMVEQLKHCYREAVSTAAPAG